jgi:hypothetical protein
MNYQAYLKDGLLNVTFNDSSVFYNDLQFSLGDGTISFSSIPTQTYTAVFEYFRLELLLCMENNGTEKDLINTLSEYVKVSYDIDVYLNFYIDAYTFVIGSLRDGREKMLDYIPRLLRDFLFNSGEGLDIDGIDFTNVGESSKIIGEIFIQDIIARQARLKEDFEIIAGNAEEYKVLSPMQKLYLLSKQGRNYLSGEFRTRLAPDYALIQNENDLSIIKSTLLENKVDIVEMVDIRSIDNLMSYELYHTLKSNMLIRRCKHCDEFFIVRGRIDTEYCDRVKSGESKPCSIIGAARSYWGSKEGDVIYTAFQKAYKRNHSRQRVGKITQSQFYEWSEEARRKRGECETGQLSLDEFNAWLGNKR